MLVLRLTIRLFAVYLWSDMPWLHYSKHVRYRIKNIYIRNYSEYSDNYRIESIRLLGLLSNRIFFDQKMRYSDRFRSIFDNKLSSLSKNGQKMVENGRKMVEKWSKMVENGRKWSKNGRKWSNFFDNYRILSKILNIFDIFDNEISLSNRTDTIHYRNCLMSIWIRFFFC